jgi:hypothetical protein
MMRHDFDRWYDIIEEQIDEFMEIGQDVLLVCSAIGVVALILAQAYLAWGR